MPIHKRVAYLLQSLRMKGELEQLCHVAEVTVPVGRHIGCIRSRHIGGLVVGQGQHHDVDAGQTRQSCGRRQSRKKRKQARLLNGLLPKLACR